MGRPRAPGSGRAVDAIERSYEGRLEGTDSAREESWYGNTLGWTDAPGLVRDVFTQPLDHAQPDAIQPNTLHIYADNFQLGGLRLDLTALELRHHPVNGPRFSYTRELASPSRLHYSTSCIPLPGQSPRP